MTTVNLEIIPINNDEFEEFNGKRWKLVGYFTSARLSARELLGRLAPRSGTSAQLFLVESPNRPGEIFVAPDSNLERRDLA